MFAMKTWDVVKKAESHIVDAPVGFKTSAHSCARMGRRLLERSTILPKGEAQNCIRGYARDLAVKSILYSVGKHHDTYLAATEIW